MISRKETKLPKGAEYGYKVVWEVSEVPSSACIGGKAQVNYPIGKPVRAPKWLAARGYHLTYFRRLKEAGDFTAFRNSALYVIYRCIAQGIVSNLPPICGIEGVERGILRPLDPAVLIWPQGTCMAKKIMLLKRVR
jgi:hypothetical protein